MAFWFRRRSRASEDELREEFAFHLEEEAEQRRALGVSSEEAKWAARRELGNLTLLHEETRAAWGWRFLGGGGMSDFLADIKHSIRMFRNSPAFTVTAVAALALGIAATTAIFSIVNAVLLKPFPLRDADRFVTLLTTETHGGRSNTYAPASPVKFAEWSKQTAVLEDIFAYRPGTMNYTGGDVVEQWTSTLVSAGAFKGFPLPMLRGRGFSAEEDSPGGPHVAVISEGLWERRFGKDPQIVGKSVSLNGEAYTVVGVTTYNPAWLEWGPAPDVYVPFQLDPASSDLGNFFQVFARLKPGVSVEQANQALKASATALVARFPKRLFPSDHYSVQPYQQRMIGDTRPLLLVLLGAVVLVLLIACANVANLLLVRATARRREIAVRAAIGAGRGRVIRQLLTENVLLALAGGALGLALGYAGIRALLTVNTAGLPRLGPDGGAVNLDWRVLAFATGVSLLTGIIFGLFPALEGSRADLNTVLKDSSGRSGTGLRQNKTRAALVVSEVGLAVLLLVGSALLIRTFVALYTVNPGFESSHVLTMTTLMMDPKYQSSAAAAVAGEETLRRIRAIPGVEQAAATCCVPLEGDATLPFARAGHAPTFGEYFGSSDWSTASSGFFETLGIPVKLGRSFTDRDDMKSPPVAIVNEAFVRQFLKDADPLSERILIGHGVSAEYDAEPTRQIVGVVGDVRNDALASEPRPTMYVPQFQLPDGVNRFMLRQVPIAWMIRATGEPHRLAAAVQQQLRDVLNLPVANVWTMDELREHSVSRQRFNMLLMGTFGGLALLLAAIGIYGLMAYTVAQRKQEIGIRLALGAEASQVRNMVVRQGMALALAGVIAGLAAAWGATRLIQSFLYGVKARDPIAFLAVPAVLAVVALIAVWLPAYRAGRVSPVESLRYE